MSRERPEDVEGSSLKRRKLSHECSTQIEEQLDHTSTSKLTEDNVDEVAAPECQNDAGKIMKNHEEPKTQDQRFGRGDYADDATNLLPNQPSTSPPISKNQLKKLRKREEWEAGREYRKAKRKEKIQGKRERKKAAKAEEAEARRQAKATGQPVGPLSQIKPRNFVRLPVTILIDCGFDELMSEKERISLGSQLTRCYSDNHHAPFQAHIWVSGWGGLLRERFETVLEGHYKSWKGVSFSEENFEQVSKMALEEMRADPAGKLAGAFETKVEQQSEMSNLDGDSVEADGHAKVDGEKEPLDESHGSAEGEVIYLTSDSPHTLTTLSPYSVYIVGGLVDKNRHKGICYKTACEKGVKTAKLPIGQYMEMQSRFVLATNHVVEIMLRWLECGDWAESFLKVIPKRKGGRLKDELPQNGDDDEEESHGEVSEREIKEFEPPSEEQKTVGKVE